MGLIKFGIKCTLAGGALYYLSEEGIWKSSNHTEKIFDKIVANISPYAKELSSQMHIQIPDLPNSERTSFLFKNYWNKGILNTFAFLRDLPEKSSHLTQEGFNAIVGNDNIKDFFGSLGAPSAPQQATAVEKKPASPSK